MKRLGLVLLSPIFLWLSWPSMPLTPFVFFAFVPILLLEQQIRNDQNQRKGSRFFLWTWFAMGLFNLFTTNWIWNAHWSGVVTTVLVNGAMMALPFWGYQRVRNFFPKRQAVFILAFFWICFESIHKDWDMSWPWLTLGNVFANHPSWVQWYSYTGVFGGSLWVMLVNGFLFLTLFPSESTRLENPKWVKTVFVGLLSTLPVFLASWWMYKNYQPVGEKVEVVSVQPNIDTYTEKFYTPETEQVQKFLALAEEKVTPNTQYLVGPETLLGDGFQEPNGPSASLTLIRRFLENHPGLHFIGGASTHTLYSFAETPTARQSRRNPNIYFDAHNTAFQIDATGSLTTYHKNKLVVGVELMPFEKYLKPLLGEVVLDLGGTTGTLAGDATQKVFSHSELDLKVGAPVCFESVFGEHMSGFVRNGAQMLFVITNDDWWDDTDGKEQHIAYARLRAIESRRDIVHCANTGISAFINQRGDVSQRTKYREGIAIRKEIRANKAMSFYSLTGDFVSKVSWFILVFALLGVFVKARINK